MKLIRDFWPKAAQWERMMMQYSIHRNFHQYLKPIRKIGSGNFASVYLAKDLKKDRYVAAKAFMKESAFQGEGKAAIQNQINLMRRIKSKKNL